MPRELMYVISRLLLDNGHVVLLDRPWRVCFAMGCVKDDDSTITWDWKAMQEGR